MVSSANGCYGGESMDKFSRIYTLHQILKLSNYSVSTSKLKQELECSERTVRRVVDELRLYFDAPIETDRENGGYYYNKKQQTSFELPGIWFNVSEISALLTIKQQLKSIEKGLFENQISPLNKKIDSILQLSKIAPQDADHKFRIEKIGSRRVDEKIFKNVSSALVQSKKLDIIYLSRGSNKTNTRTVSPQRMTYYRSNWYLEAKCHLREQFRIFSIDQIQQATIQKSKAEKISLNQLDKHVLSSYGIFTGDAKNIAKLQFTPERARWVIDEQWHPEQKGELQKDGSYILQLPYSKDMELVMDILKYGADVKVLEPQTLKEEVTNRLRKALKNY